VTNKHFDIDVNKLNFINDLTFGESNKNDVVEFLRTVAQGDIEIKADRYRNGRMCVETNHNPQNRRDGNGNRIWEPSGINVTRATWWVYVFAPDSFVMVPVQRLKNYLRAHPQRYNETTKRQFGSADNYARGWLIYPEGVIDLLTHAEYDIKNN